MSTKVKRKVTVENAKEAGEQPRRPSVFERLGPGAMNVPTSQPQDRHGRIDHNEKCRNWLRGNCSYGSTCRFQHELYSTGTKRSQKSEKEVPEKDLRHKVRKPKEEHKETKPGSLSPPKSKTRSSSRNHKGEHESKIKSTVVVTRPRSPAPGTTAEAVEEKKKKPDGSWEEDSDDWPMDAAQLDYKEELTLERKRQQLQRELELELQKERMMGENVTITKTISFSESSSTSSSSGSGSVSSSTDSSSSSSDDDSDESSSSSSSTSSSASRTSKKKYKKSLSKKDLSSSIAKKKNETSVTKKPLDDYDKIKSSRNAKAAAAASRTRLLSPVSPETSKRRNRDYRISLSPAESPKHHRSVVDSGSKGSSKMVHKGPRTPSPLPIRKERSWGQRSSVDSRGGDSKRSKGGKKHKKKKESSRNDGYKYNDNVTVPPRLSSPNRTQVQSSSGKKLWSKDEFSSKTRHKHRDSSPGPGSKYSTTQNSPTNRHVGVTGHSADTDKYTKKHGKSNQKIKKSDDNLPHSYKLDHREHSSKHSKFSPPKDDRQSSISPHRDKYDNEAFSRRVYSISDDKTERRRTSLSPGRYDKDSKDRRKKDLNNRKDFKDTSPRSHDSRRDSRYQDSDLHRYGKKGESKTKRPLSPEPKKMRDDRKDHGPRDRSLDHDSWVGDSQKKGSGRLSDSRGHLGEPPGLSISARNERGRDRDRKKVKERDLPPLRDDKDRDRQRLGSPLRKGQEILPHHVVRDEVPLPVPRGRLYEADLPTNERDYAYAYPPHREPAYIDDRALPPEFDPELLHHGPVLFPPPPAEAADYPPPVFADPLYRREIPALKEPAHIERLTGYVPRDISPLDPREPVILPREEDYLDMTIDERRACDERWGRNRPLRDDWDPFSGLPPPGLPPHVSASLSEDRYGMPRRRRASPDWHLHRDERDLPIRERRSRSPQHRRSDDMPGRAPWRDERGGDRHTGRPSDSRNDNQQKQDDRKRGYRRDRRDLNKKSDDVSSGQKSKEPPKEKPSLKQAHSSSPGRKDVKRKKEESSHDTASISASDKRKNANQRTEASASKNRATSESTSEPRSQIKVLEDTSSSLVGKGSFYLMQLMEASGSTTKKTKDEGKHETKPSSNRKTGKTDVPPVKQEIPAKSGDKKENQERAGPKSSTKPDCEEKKKRSNDNKSQVDDNFSDWSDGDDDLLNRDLVEVDSSVEKSRSKAEESKKEKKLTSDTPVAESKDNTKETSKKKRDGSKDSRARTSEIKSESRSRTGSKERPSTESSGMSKIEVLSHSSKETDLSEGYVVKDEAIGEPDDFITTESVDYDPISDDELEAMIEEPSDSLIKAAEDSEKTKIVDALDVDWSVLMNDPKPEFLPGNAKKRFKTAHVLARIGFSQALAGPELSEKLIKFCQRQLDDEKDDESTEKTFQMEHHIAAFHVTLAERKKERKGIFNKVGPARRALCARQDLHIRKLLCRPTHKLVIPNSCVQQHGSVDLKNQKMKGLESQTPVVNSAC